MSVAEKSVDHRAFVYQCRALFHLCKQIDLFPPIYFYGYLYGQREG